MISHRRSLGAGISRRRFLQSSIVGLAGIATLRSQTADAGKDLRLSYRSAIDKTDQPYRLYVPSNYDGKTPLPLVIALHGTSGNEATLFEQYGNGQIKRVAEKHGVLLVSPFGRGITEYYGIGENDVLCVLADVQGRYRVDPERIYITGHSMGGTGTAHLALRYPDLFAAAAPLAAAYSHPWLAANGQHVPFWWLLGGDDLAFYQKGVRVGAERMIQLGCPTKLDILAGKGHGDWVPDYFEPVFAWFLKHRRVARPRQYVFTADLPTHGQAYSTAIDRIAKPGTVGTLTVRVEREGTIQVDTKNVAALAVLPDPELVDLARPIRVMVNGSEVFSGKVSDRQEIQCLAGQDGTWKAMLAVRRQRDLTAWRAHPVATASRELTMEGIEAPLANWITDAMRSATSADIALYNRRHYRGLPIPKGSVDVVDLVQASRPFNEYLVTAELTGAELLAILEDNIRDAAKDADRLVQVAGCRYGFDRSRPLGSRIVSADLEAKRTYKVVLEGQVPKRETIFLAGRFGKLEYQVSEVPFWAALFAHAQATGRINAQVDGRVREVKAEGK